MLVQSSINSTRVGALAVDGLFTRQENEKMSRPSGRLSIRPLSACSFISLGCRPLIFIHAHSRCTPIKSNWYRVPHTPIRRRRRRPFCHTSTEKREGTSAFRPTCAVRLHLLPLNFIQNPPRFAHSPPRHPNGLHIKDLLITRFRGHVSEK